MAKKCHNFGIIVKMYVFSVHKNTNRSKTFFRNKQKSRSKEDRILVNSPNETKYYYQDFVASGVRLNGVDR
jgi:hypothetical protein